MKKVYVYVMDTQADWELGYVTAEIYSKRFFKKDAPEIELKTVGISKEMITTMGGLKVTPDCKISDMTLDGDTTLILPGSNTWQEPKHAAMLQRAGELLTMGGTVAAICGATVALACCGILNERPHTSNGVGFLDMFAQGYSGQAHYVDKPAMRDGNLITAGATGALEWTKEIIESLGVFKEETLNAWEEYFKSGDAGCFYALMNSLE